MNIIGVEKAQCAGVNETERPDPLIRRPHSPPCASPKRPQRNPTPGNYVIHVSVNRPRLKCASPTVSSWPRRPRSAPSLVSARLWPCFRRSSYTAASCAFIANSSRRCVYWAIHTSRRSSGRIGTQRIHFTLYVCFLLVDCLVWW